MQHTEQNLPDVDQKPIQGEIPDTIEVFYANIGDEMFKSNLNSLNDILRQLLSTSTALMGGGIVFLSADLCGASLRIAALIMFFLAVVIALIGIHPYRDSVHLGMPYEIKRYLDNATWWKDSFVWACSIFLGLGLLLAFVGVVTK